MDGHYNFVLSLSFMDCSVNTLSMKYCSPPYPTTRRWPEGRVDNAEAASVSDEGHGGCQAWATALNAL